MVGLKPLLETLSSVYSQGSKGAAVLKLNAAELCKLVNVPKKESERVTMEELKESTTSFIKNFNANGLDYLCVTDGRFPGYLVELSGEKRIWQMDTIDLSDKGSTLFPIGAGDTVAAGTLAAWQYLHSCNGVISSETGAKISEKQSLWSTDNTERGILMATSFAFGIACGSASCLKEENSVFDVSDAETFLESMNQPVLME